jgi:hypothetical protein
VITSVKNWRFLVVLLVCAVVLSGVAGVGYWRWSGDQQGESQLNESGEEIGKTEEFALLKESFLKQRTVVLQIAEATQAFEAVSDDLQPLLDTSSQLAVDFESFEKSSEKWAVMQEHVLVSGDILMVLSIKFLDKNNEKVFDEQLRSAMQQFEGTRNEWTILSSAVESLVSK